MAEQKCCLCSDTDVIFIIPKQKLYVRGAKHSGPAVGPNERKALCSRHMKLLTTERQK